MRWRNPFRVDPEVVEQAAAALPIPILWLLGKTGAGKSSLVRALTGLDAAKIGSGFVPCTRTSVMFDFPPEAPLLRFLDTRGLGESGYDPAEDLAACDGHSHAVLVVARIDDPVQGEVIAALGRVLARAPDKPVLLLQTGADLIPDAGQRDRAARAVRDRFAAAIGRDIPAVTVALPPGGAAPGALDPLIDDLAGLLPQAALLLRRDAARTEEQARFVAIRTRVLFYAGIAGASDVAPLVGAVSVPAAQGAMLRELGRHYGVTWSGAILRSFLATLGAGIVARYAALFGMRQIGKLIPGFGQTVVGAASGSVSFATTYALGRAAAYYLHHRQAGNAVETDDLREVYAAALRRAGRPDA